ncbi:tyrosine-type recombinase/integrase [Kineococcus sp. SYSU DK005]|uniref:tyrosine-type recombinase/integrase n=1 Tax=Kineococcus sp. SYSU DK005 TaxID=3383126 RepID=UPI003D7F0810
MAVREVVMPDGAKSFTLLDEDGVLVDVVDAFLTYLTVTERSPHTVRAYAYDLATYWHFLGISDVAWDRVNPAMIGDYIHHLRWFTAAPGVTPLRPQPRRAESSVNRMLAALGSFYEFHQRNGADVGSLLPILRGQRNTTKFRGFLAHLDRGPRQRSQTVRLKRQTRSPTVLSEHEVRSVISACSHLRDRLLIGVMFDGGLRIGEALGLRYEDIDPARARLTIVARNDNANGARAKTGGRRIPVSDALIRLYNDYLDEEVGALDTDYVFVKIWREPAGEPLSYAAAHALLQRLRARSGVHFTFHHLRHTYATDLLRAGVTGLLH